MDEPVFKHVSYQENVMDESLLLSRLDELANFKEGEMPPEWLPANKWGQPLSELCREAAAKIRFLRSVAGAVSQ